MDRSEQIVKAFEQLTELVLLEAEEFEAAHPGEVNQSTIGLLRKLPKVLAGAGATVEIRGRLGIKVEHQTVPRVLNDMSESCIAMCDVLTRLQFALALSKESEAATAKVEAE